MMLARRMVAGLLLVGLLIISSDAAAKQFNPGDLRVCNAKRCVMIESRPVLNALSAFYYDSALTPARISAPRLGVPFFRLEFANGYVTGIIVGRLLARFLSYGVNLDQFRAGVWYRLPARAVAGLRALTVGLIPLRLAGTALADSPTFAVPRPSAAQPQLRARRQAATGGHGNSLPWALGVVSLAALIALALLARARRRPRAAQLPT
jgi:hypothetical protein